MIFYTDGACHGNPGSGGWAYISLSGCNIAAAAYGFEDETTNNRMELYAILEVFKFIDQNQTNDFAKERYEIISDSAYAINTITSWMEGWERNGWTRSKGQKVENLELIKELYNYYITKKLKNQVHFSKIHGHAGILGNELCDAICSGNKSKYNTLIKQNNINDDIIYYGRITNV